MACTLERSVHDMLHVLFSDNENSRFRLEQLWADVNQSRDISPETSETSVQSHLPFGALCWLKPAASLSKTQICVRAAIHRISGSEVLASQLNTPGSHTPIRFRHLSLEHLQTEPFLADMVPDGLGCQRRII